MKWIVFAVVLLSFMSKADAKSAPAEMTFVTNHLIFEGSKKTPQMRSAIMFAHQFCRKDKGFFRAAAASSRTESLSNNKVRIIVEKVTCTDNTDLAKAKPSFEMLNAAGYLPPVAKKPKAVVNALKTMGIIPERGIASAPKGKKNVQKINMKK